ncbi:MAG: hypothetical protein ACFE9A_20140 [Candidatus Hodarchaeota archaeon]
MSDTTLLTGKILEIAEAVKAGEIDPLELKLTEAYRELRELASKIEERIDIDEMLNAVLGAKVTRVQELARILATPELYASMMKKTSPRALANMIAYHGPVRIGHLDPEPMMRSMDRMLEFIDALSKELPKEQIPKQGEVPDDFAFATEDAVFLEDLELFSASLPEGVRTPISEIVETDNLDDFLRRFLYVVILISRGEVQYFTETKEILKVENNNSNH